MSEIVVSGAENVHVHIISLKSSLDWTFTGLAISSFCTVFTFFGGRNFINDFNVAIIMLHCVPPSLISISDLIGDVVCKCKLLYNNGGYDKEIVI